VDQCERSFVIDFKGSGAIYDRWYELNFLNNFLVLLNGFEADPTEIQHYIDKLRGNARESLFNKIKDSASHLSLRMHKKFEDQFRYIFFICFMPNVCRFENGLPRVFKKLQDITSKFQSARDYALQLLDLFFLFRLDPALDDYHLDLDANAEEGDFQFPQSSNPEFEKNIILGEDACLRIFDNFTLKCQGSLKDAQANFLAQQARRTNLPMWIFPILLILGWNEIMYVLSRPLLLLVILLIGLILFWTYLRSELYNYIDSDDANPTLAIGLRFVLTWLDRILTPAVFLGRQQPQPEQQEQQPEQVSVTFVLFSFYRNKLYLHAR
jgi:hypothetical protein